MTIIHFTVVCLVTWPMNETEAGVDLVLIETSLSFLCKFLLTRRFLKRLLGIPYGADVGCYILEEIWQVRNKKSKCFCSQLLIYNNADNVPVNIA